MFKILRYWIVNFQILLHINLPTKDELDFKEYRQFEDEIFCCN